MTDTDIKNEINELLKLMKAEIEDGADPDEELRLYKDAVKRLVEPKDGFTGYNIAQIDEVNL